MKINDSDIVSTPLIIVFGLLTMIMPYGFLVAKDLQISDIYVVGDPQPQLWQSHVVGAALLYYVLF